MIANTIPACALIAQHGCFYSLRIAAWDTDGHPMIIIGSGLTRVDAYVSDGEFQFVHEGDWELTDEQAEEQIRDMFPETLVTRPASVKGREPHQAIRTNLNEESK